MAAPTPHFEARQYSPDELVQMRRDLPAIHFIVAKLNKHPDIAVILRIPKEALSNPEQYSCKSESLFDTNNGNKLSISSRRNIGGGLSEGSGGPTVVPLDLTSGSQRVKWNLRPRGSSDHSSQPHSAPTGLEAQQSENFRRFYRAVVSPTHVRVTAGGRIVPNTRAIGAPLFEWNNEKQIFEPRQPSSDAESNSLRIPTLLPTTAFAPGFPPFLPASILAPYGHVPHQNPQPLAAMAIQNMGSVGGNVLSPAPSGETAVDTLHPPGMPHLVRISHPSQFDHSKPFMFNGKLVYPIPPGHLPPSYALPIPVSMVGTPNLGPSVLPHAGFFMPQPVMPMVRSNDVHASPYDQNPTLSNSNVAQTVQNSGSYNTYLSLPGQVSVADITKFQIEGFRNHLSFINDQLSNGQNRIDVQYLEGQRADLMAIIEKMETMLTIQLAYGQRQDVSPYLNGLMQVGVHNQPAKSIVNEDLRQMPVNEIGIDSSTNSREGPAASSIATAPLSKNPICSGDAGTNFAKGQTRSDHTATKSKLTPAAAMAPPFQPRTKAIIATNSFPGIANNPTTYSASFGTQAYDTDRTTSLGHATYSPNVSGTGHAPLLATPSVHNASTYTQNEGTLAGQYTTPNDPAMPTISPAAVPYLVGTFPQGVQGSEAKVTDPQYPRPLNDEELRARFLYWGRAPRSAYGGLPKFDGKDFYPPSPIKETNRMRTVSPAANSTNRRHRTPVEINFERLFAVPENANYNVVSSETNNVRTISKLIPSQHTAASFQYQLPGLSSSIQQDSLRPGLSADHQGDEHPKYTLAVTSSIDHGTGDATLPDFSNLFLEEDDLEFKPSRSAHLGVSQSDLDFSKGKTGRCPSPGNPKPDMDNKEDSDDVKSVDSWGASTNYYEVTMALARNEAPNSSSTHEIPSTASIKDVPSKRGHEHNLLSRPESSSCSEQHALFLQNMLRSSAQMRMAAPALRTVSSATAQGYLPQYRGSAAASLAPAMLSMPSSERDAEHRSPKPEHQSRSVDGIVPAAEPSLLGENRPLNRDQSPRPIPPNSDTLDAEGYMRYLSQKADENKRITDNGWNANTSGSRHVTGSDW